MSSMLILPQDDDTWVGVKTALELLGLKNKSSLYYHTGSGGAIRSRKSPANERDNEYNLGDLKRLAANRKNQTASYAPVTSVLRWVTIADLPSLLTLEYETTGQYPDRDNNRLAAWIKTNPQTVLGVFSLARPETCLAYLSAVIVDEELIVDAVATRNRVIDYIQDDDIGTYHESGAVVNDLTLFINALAAREPAYLEQVLQGFASYWKTLLPVGKVVRRMLAETDSPAQQKLLQGIGFSYISIIENRTLQQDKVFTVFSTNYILDLRLPMLSPALSGYQEAVIAQNKEE